MPNGLNSIPTAYEYPISFPDTLYAAYASPHLAATGLTPHSNPAFSPYPLVYRPSSLYFPSSTAAVSMHPHQNTNHPVASSNHPNAAHLPLNHPTIVQSPVNLQTGSAQENQYSTNQQASIQSHSSQQSAQATHHPSRLSSNNSNNPNSNQMASNSAASNQSDGGYQSQYHLHHLNSAGTGSQHHNTHHQHIHHSHQPSHAQNTNLASNTSNANQQQHTTATPVFINATTGMPYIHPHQLHSLQYNPNVGAFTPNTTQPHSTSLTHHQPHYTHNPSQHHSQPQFSIPNPNWIPNNSQWR